jgi:hypothetical protein
VFPRRRELFDRDGRAVGRFVAFGGARAGAAERYRLYRQSSGNRSLRARDVPA